MVRKILVILVALSLLLVIGCGQRQTNSLSVNPISAAKSPANTTILSKEPSQDVTWISPGKVQVGNFYPGARAEWELSIHNGKDKEARFEVKYRFPDHVGEGYTKPTPETQDWVIIADSTPVLAPKETRNILIALDMPENAVSSSKKWEFWVSVRDTTQGGNIGIELCSRWLVAMR